MRRGISYQGFLAVRKEPSNQAEMVSQVLFGESFTIEDAVGTWLGVKMDYEGSEGWIHESGVQYTEEAEKPETGSETGSGTTVLLVSHPSLRLMDTLHERPLLLPGGSILRHHMTERFKKFNDEGWITPGEGIDPEVQGKLLLTIPAMHGGRCGFGFDAPGLVQMLGRSMGLVLPHSIMDQAALGNTLNFMHEACPGDLAFFHDGEDEFTHVGLVLDKGRIIHVSDQVRIDKLDQQGIYCAEKESYTHQIRLLKSL